MKTKIKEFVTPLDVAKLLNVEDQYLKLLTEQEKKENFIQSEIEKTEKDFFDNGYVELPK